jgi:hypothetical protein
MPCRQQRDAEQREQHEQARDLLRDTPPLVTTGI